MPFDLSISAAAQLRQFLLDNLTALLAACRLLGGDPAAARLHRLVRTGMSGRELRRRYAALHDLLTLRHVGDPDRIETGCFAAIRPDDARVPEICRLADELEALLAADPTSRAA